MVSERVGERSKPPDPVLTSVKPEFKLAHLVLLLLQGILLLLLLLSLQFLVRLLELRDFLLLLAPVEVSHRLSVEKHYVYVAFCAPAAVAAVAVLV